MCMDAIIYLDCIYSSLVCPTIGLMVTSIYRLPGDADQVKKLRHRIDQGKYLCAYIVLYNYLGSN